jgi:AraC-like DNA-binding protein/mannose-6-phosphate isomerase-like protein (cupin superfamily)
MLKANAMLEPMYMPNPHFPIKVHRCKANEYGKILFSNHWHKHIEFLYFVSGKAAIECNSVEFIVQSGELIVMNSNDLHAGVSLSDDLFYYAIILDPSLVQSHAMDAVETKFITPITENLILFNNRIENDTSIKNCILSIVHELDNLELGYELSIKSHLFAILTLLLRGYVAQILSFNDYKARMINLERLTPILEYIETNFHQELTVELLAGKAGLSRFHFSRLFKDLTGKSVTNYINSVRIRRAEYLLRNTPMTISEVALSVGYRDIYYFSRIFKKYKDVPPSQMQRTGKNRL